MSSRRLRGIAAFGVAVLASTAVLAADTVASTSAPDLASARARIKAKDFAGAIAELTPLLDKVQHADIYNLLGFSFRKSGDLKLAATYYAKALDFDADHKSALEYQGEMFVEQGDLDRAKANLAKLEKLCPSGCEERDDLAAAISGAATPKSTK